MSTDSTTSRSAKSPLFSALIGLASLAVLLQGVWAGLFIHASAHEHHRWLQVHQQGGNVAVVLGVLAAIAALVQLRARRDLVIGSIVFAVGLVVELVLGNAVGSHARLAAIHIPLAMALLALAVWLPTRARAGR